MEEQTQTQEKGKIVEQIRKFVEDEYRKPDAHYGYGPYSEHLVPMKDYAVELAERLGADTEIVEIATWLHDIGSCMYGRENHHVTGAEIAERKLREFGYVEEKIEKIKECIFSHRGSNHIQGKSPEAKIISDADTISNFDNLPGLFMASFVYENQNQQEARKSVREKLERKWNKLYFEDSRELIKKKYAAAMLLLKHPADE